MSFATPIIRNIKGDDGEPGSLTTEEYLSGETVLSGHRVVFVDADEAVYYASNDDIDHVFAPVGMSTGAAAIGDPVTVVIGGVVEEVTWSWTPQVPLYLGTNGQLTETPPTLGGGALFSQVIGYAITATKIQIQIHQPVILA